MPGFADALKSGLMGPTYYQGKDDARTAEIRDRQFAQQGQQFDQQQEDRKRQEVTGLVRYFKQLTPGQRKFVYESPQVQAKFREWGVQAPPQWDESNHGWLDQAEALNLPVGSVQGGRVQSTYVNGAGKRVAIMADGTERELGDNDPGMANQTITVKNRQGQDVQYTFNKRTGQYEEPQFGAPAPQSGPPLPPAAPPAPPGVDPTAEYAATANFMRENGVPEERILDWIGKQPGTVPGSVNPQAIVPRGGMVGPTPGEVVAQQEQARVNTTLANAPAVNANEAAAAAARKRAEMDAEAAGESAAALPTLLNNAQQTMDVLDQALKHPGLATATGLSSKLDPRNKVPGTDAYNFNVLSEQIKGKAFLEAFNSLRGGGAITEREGAAATAAIGRLDTAQSEEEYVKALKELRRIVQLGMSRARAKAGKPEPKTAAAGFRVLD
jgi:hypothetical protein